MIRRRRSECEQGSVLLYVVWAVLLLALFAAGVGSQALFAVALPQRLTYGLQSAYIAQGAISYLTLALERDPTPSVDGLGDPWNDDPGQFMQRPLAGGWFRVTAPPEAGAPVRYGMADEERRVNVNTAPAEILARLFEVAGGMESREAAEVSAAIEDWRDEDEIQRPLGAEDFYYQSLREPYECKDAPLENVEELLLIKGISPELYRRIEPFVTVHGLGQINLNTASATVLQTLDVSKPGLEGLLYFRAGEDNREHTADDRQLISTASLSSDLNTYVPVEDIARLATLARQGVVGTRSRAFRALIHAEHAGKSSRTEALCVLERGGTLRLWSQR